MSMEMESMKLVVLEQRREGGKSYQHMASGENGASYLVWRSPEAPLP